MFEVLFTWLENKFALTSADKTLIQSVLQSRELSKNEFLLRAGEIPRHGAFVCKGFLRSYIIDDKGKEHIVQFAPENWWISARPDGANDKPSPVFIDAIEDTSVLLLEKKGHELLMEKIPGYAATFHAGMQKRGEAKDNRIVNALVATAEEKYNDFLKTYPSIAQRIPQHMLASYLGITPETISRIRRKSVGK